MWIKWRRRECLAGRSWSSHGSWRDGSRAGALIAEHHPVCAPCRNQWVQPNEGWNLISICLLYSPLTFQDLMSSPWDRGAPSFCLRQNQADSVGEICYSGGWWIFLCELGFISSMSDSWVQFCINIQNFASALKYLFKKHQIMSSFSPRA